MKDNKTPGTPYTTWEEKVVVVFYAIVAVIVAVIVIIGLIFKK